MVPVKQMKASIQRLLAAFEDEQEVLFINRSGINVRDRGGGGFEVIVPFRKTGGYVPMYYVNKAAATIMTGLGMRRGDTDPALSILDGRVSLCIFGQIG